MSVEPILDEPIISFAGPAHIPYASVTKHIWGDSTAGLVSDWTYLSSEHLTQLLFGLPPHRAFQHSEDFKTIFAADELYFVVSGELVLSNPATGESVRARRGESIFFQRDTWHHGFNVSDEPLRVVEYFAPPPAKGTGAAYARQQPNLERVRYTQDELLSRRNPLERDDRATTLKLVRERDAILRLDGNGTCGVTLILVGTVQLTVGILELLPGQQTEPHVHGGDEGVFVLEGQPFVRIVGPTPPALFELKPCDGAYIPLGVQHQYANWSDKPARLLFGIAPFYFPRP